jgi:hypothetical protein
MSMARPEQEVADELAALGYPVGPRPLQSIAEALVNGETVVDAYNGAEHGQWMERYNGLVLVTRLRILYIHYWIGSKSPAPEYREGEPAEVTTVWWSDIANIDRHNRQDQLSVRSFEAAGGFSGDYTGEELKSQKYKDFVQCLQDRLAVVKASAARRATPSEDWLRELERLAALRQSGALTDEEFQLAKLKLLYG